MRRMHYSGDVASAAQQFAKVLHDRWGVGDATCNNGVLLFLSTEDRQLYISTGTGTASRLTFDVLGDIIDDVRPALKESRYDEAVERAVVDIGLALAGRAVEPEGRGGTGWDDLLGLAIFGSAAGGMLFWAARSESRKRRRYQDCKSKLEKLKRDQAAMRSNSYNPTSCPVCLEDFADASSPVSSNNGGEGSGGEAAGAAAGAAAGETGNGACGACESTAAGGKVVPGGAVERKASLGARSSDNEEAELRRPLMMSSAAAAGTAAAGSGAGGVELTDAAASGGLGAVAAGGAAGAGAAAGGGAGGGAGAAAARRPLVLPCGHAFCEACITKWLDQKKVTCPICRKPFDDEDDSPEPTTRPPRSPATAPRPGATDPSSATAGGPGPSSSSSGPRPPCTVDDDDETVYYDRHGSPAFASAPRWGSAGAGAAAQPRLRLRWGGPQRRRFGFGGMPGALQEELLLAEMMFRLRQLQVQHPDYITPGMLQSWEQDLQQGREFNSQQLREFQLRDPATRQALAHSGSSGTHASFGGGSGGGGGGRGGSW